MIIRNGSKAILLCLGILLSSYSVSLTVEDFTTQASLRDVELSPSGQYLASVWNVKNRRVLTVQDRFKEGEPIVLKYGNKVTRPHTVYWANDNRLLVRVQVPRFTNSARKKANKNEEYDFYDNPYVYKTLAVNPDGTEAKLIEKSSLQHLLPGDHDHVLSSKFRDGRTILYKVNVYTGKATKIASGGKRTFKFMITPSGEVKYRLDYLRISKSILILELDKNNSWKRVEKISLEETQDSEEELGDFSGLRGDNELLYIKKNQDTGYKELISRNTKSGEINTVVSLDNKSVYDVIRDAWTGEVIGYRAEEDDVIRNFYFDQEFQIKYQTLVNKTKDQGISSFRIYSASKSGEEVVLLSNGPDDPGIYVMYNFETGNLDYYDYKYSNLKVEAMASPATLTYKARDGQNIKSYALLPSSFKKGAKLPLVVIPHGGPQARNYAYYSGFSQFIATRGYIVLKPNFRGSTGYGKAFEEAGYKQWGGVMQDDLEDGVRFMIDKGYVDAAKVCIVGSSYGGYAALMGVVKTPDLYKCAISINGVTDLLAQVKFDAKRFKELPKIVEEVHSTIGHPKIDKELLEANSPALHVEHIKAPILLVAGEWDNVVPFKQSKKMAKNLKKHKKEYKFIKVEEAGHNVLYYYDDIELVYPEIEAFLSEYLGPSEQYLRKGIN